MIPHFKKENNIQKVQCVVLSDGEAGGMKYHKEVQRRWEIEPFLGVGVIGHRRGVCIPESPVHPYGDTATTIVPRTGF